MIRVAIEVDDGRDCFRLLVYAESLQQAVRYAADRYPDHAVGVRFPLDPDTFFVNGSVGDKAIKVEVVT